MRVSALVAAAAVILTSSSAYAFCRTTTCSPSTCHPSAACDYCLEGGIPLYWPGGCTSFSVQANGSPLRGISPALTYEIVRDSFVKWISVDCGGAAPGIHLFQTSPVDVTCSRQEYNQESPNANIWMYRDDYWPYAGTGSTLALTTVTFNVETGEIFDADVEINSIETILTTSDEGVQGDLWSIVTHEAGHFLGLSHSCAAAATMFANYQIGSVELRSLEADDVAGICTIYPPGSDSPYCDPTPRHGFSRSAVRAKKTRVLQTAPGGPQNSGFLGHCWAWAPRPLRGGPPRS